MKLSSVFLIALLAFSPAGRFDNVPQMIPLNQDWSFVNLFTDNDWSLVPGFVGYKGSGLTTVTGADPQTILAPANSGDINVYCNRNDPNIFASGGVAEFEISNRSIALQPSNEADAPYLLLNLNTMGHQNILISYNLRDLDGSIDNAVQPVALQWREGDTGNFINIPAGFVPDATGGPGIANLTTPVIASLPLAAQNKAWIQVRIITANAAGNDEWVGIDDIAVSSSNNPAPVVTTTPGTTAYVHPTPVIVDNGITVTDANNASLASATVQVYGDFPTGADQLQFAPDGTTGDIFGNYVPVQGTLTLTSSSGLATLAQWQSALRLVRYVSFSLPQHTDRYVRFAVSDGVSPSNIAYKKLSLTGPGNPVVTTSGGVTNHMVGTPVAIDNALTVSDPNSATLSTATVQFSGNFQAFDDVLGFTNNPATMGNVSGSYDPLNSKLSLSSTGSSATLAQWQAALRAVTFATGGAVQTYNRTISFVVNDGTFNSVTASKTVSITTSVPPVVTTSAGATTYVHGVGAIIDNSITVTDIDNTTLASATIEFTNYSPGDYFQFSNDGSTMGNIVGAVGPPNNTLTLTGAGSTIAQWQSALRSIRYLNTITTPVASDRMINFKVNDGGVNSNTAHKTISYMPLSSAGFNWSTPIHTVDPNAGTDGNVGQNSSLAVVNGNPAIAYSDDTRRNLLYMRATDTEGINFSTPITIDSIGGPGLHITLLMVNGNPAISYYDIATKDLKFVRANDPNGNSWPNPIIVDSAGDRGEKASMCIVGGHPAIAYADMTNHSIKYIRATDPNGSGWGSSTSVTLEEGTVEVLGIALRVINASPAFAVSYRINSPSSQRSLKYVKANDATGTSWGQPLLIKNLNYTSSVDMQFINGKPAIVYQNPNLTYIRSTDANGTAWGTQQIIDAAVQSRSKPSMQVVKGYPAIAYYDGTEQDLQFIRASDSSGISWQAPRFVDYAGVVGASPSLTLVNGFPAISYYDQTNGDIKYIRASDSIGFNYNFPYNRGAWGMIGSYTSLQLVNENPALAFYNESTEGLYFQRAENSTGTAWFEPIPVDTVGLIGKFASLKVVVGNPAIAYYDQTNGNLKYLRATNSLGTSWGTPVNVDITGDVGYMCSMMVVNGNPAIAYFDATNANLKFVRANDASGLSWGTPVTIDAIGNVGYNPILQIVNGNPAIAYRDLSNDDLKFVRANDATGLSWGTPLIIDGSAEGLTKIVMELINGNPAVAYQDDFSMLKYIRANDNSGSSWGSPIYIASSDAGDFFTLKLINGFPAVVYTNIDENILKFATSADQNGMSWNNPVVLDSGRQVGEYLTMLSEGSLMAIAYYTFGEYLPYFIKGTIGFISAATHHFRSRQTGNWNEPNSWESSPDNIHWATATLSPDASAASITVRTGHTLTVTANVTVDNLFTQSGSTIVTNTGIHFMIL